MRERADPKTVTYGLVVLTLFPFLNLSTNLPLHFSPAIYPFSSMLCLETVTYGFRMTRIFSCSNRFCCNNPVVCLMFIEWQESGQCWKQISFMGD